ncbi:MAG: hypothetical protein JW754_03125 [Candidatus Aenigmarchaeota archaeon]|nr:hypothetical protein [Candidatus Aenigmarchaeota archaeon]
MKKKTLILSMVFAGLFIALLHTDYSESRGSAMFIHSSRLVADIGTLGTGAATVGILIEYVIFLVVIYLFLRGIVSRFGK